jgi:hypothetical protein
MTHVDPFGLDYGIGVDPNAAGGNGHTTLYLQDPSGNWYEYNQGAAGPTRGSSGDPRSPGEGSLGHLMGEEAAAGVGISPLPKPPSDALIYKSDAATDALIAKCALESQQSHMSGDTKYDLYSNNCTDAVVDVLDCAGIWVVNPPLVPKPNSWVELLRKTPPRPENDIINYYRRSK